MDPAHADAWGIGVDADAGRSELRRRRANDSVAWRKTVTQHVPETWPAARLALQARIAALDIEA